MEVLTSDSHVQVVGVPQRKGDIVVEGGLSFALLLHKSKMVMSLYPSGSLMLVRNNSAL